MEDDEFDDNQRTNIWGRPHGERVDIYQSDLDEQEEKIQGHIADTIKHLHEAKEFLHDAVHEVKSVKFMIMQIESDENILRQSPTDFGVSPFPWYVSTDSYTGRPTIFSKPEVEAAGGECYVNPVAILPQRSGHPLEAHPVTTANAAFLTSLPSVFSFIQAFKTWADKGDSGNPWVDMVALESLKEKAGAIIEAISK